MSNEALELNQWNTQDLLNTIAANGAWLGEVPIDQVAVDTINPRKHRDPAVFAAFKADIGRKGINQPVLLRINQNTKSGLPLLIVAGEGRYIAAAELNFNTLPAKVVRLTNEEAMDAAGSENIHRNNMTAIEEGVHAERRLVVLKNDLQAVATELGWSERKLKSRLLLQKACIAVRKALAEGAITLGHTELLCGLTEESQVKLLGMIQSQSLDVASTKTLIEKLQRDLSKACFDTTDCNGCAHNTSAYTDLFDTVQAGGKCRSAVCWDNKVQEQIVVIVDEAKSTYGVVKRDDEVTPESFATLQAQGASGVGATQLAACAGCSHYGCTVSTLKGMEGMVRGPLCFDLNCHKGMIAAYQESLKAPQTDSATPEPAVLNGNAPATVRNSRSKAGTPKPAKATVQQIPKAQRLVAYEVMAKAAATEVVKSPSAMRAVTLCQFVLSSRPSSETLKKHGIDAFVSSSNSHKLLQKLLKASDGELESLEESLVQHYLTATQNAESFEQDGGRARALAVCTYMSVDLRRHWEADAAFLGLLTKEKLSQACTQSGFVDAYEDKAGDGAFKKLASGKAVDFLKAVTAYPFDWNGWLPECMDFRPVVKKLFSGQA